MLICPLHGSLDVAHDEGCPFCVLCENEYSRHRRRRFVLHNLVAHPLLVLCPPLGRWLHERSAPFVAPELEVEGVWPV